MAIAYRKATYKDIEILIKLRLEYLTEDRGELSKDETEAVVSQLQDYFTRQLNSSFIALLAENDGQAISTVYMAVAEKPANPAFITGKTATILNVFTYPDNRRKGIATKLLTMVINEAKAMNISYLELSATDSGKPLYEKLGFVHRQSKYTEMRLGLL
jgi:GNAT superfamily N-acetyltransferase